MRLFEQFMSLIMLGSPGIAQTNLTTPHVCAQCHVQALSQPETYMAHALEKVESSKILNEHPVLTVKIGKYSYTIERKGNQSEYSVTDGSETLTLPIRWAMGADFAIGQTYILEKDAELYESRVSWYRELEGLGPTLGSNGSAPNSLTEAAGRLLSHEDKTRCFGCHSTNANDGKKLTLERLIPGVQCQHCHQATDRHLSAILHESKGPLIPAQLTDLNGMSAEQAANFCGQCHRTWEEIARQGHPSIANIRFQPYRLTNSKCYDPDDKRISCLACHDPHRQTTGTLANYDSKCLACHAGRQAKPGAKVCPVKKTDCVTCHMPRLELPGAHFKFLDHRIRVVRPNEPYPG
jgi:nitrate reductase cytochrome c-type subunit